MEFEPMLTPREKSPLPENVPRGVSNPQHFGSEPKHWAIPAPTCTVLGIEFNFIKNPTLIAQAHNCYFRCKCIERHTCRLCWSKFKARVSGGIDLCWDLWFLFVCLLFSVFSFIGMSNILIYVMKFSHVSGKLTNRAFCCLFVVGDGVCFNVYYSLPWI